MAIATAAIPVVSLVNGDFLIDDFFVTISSKIDRPIKSQQVQVPLHPA